MPPKKGKKAPEPEVPRVPRDLTEPSPLDGRDGALGIENLEVQDRIHEVQEDLMLFKISSAIASGDLDLDLRDCGAQTLPAELLDLPLLAGLDASRNALTNDVFEQLKDFPHLRAVNLTCNLLTSTLPPAIGALPSAMEEICLDDNVIEQLPLDMAALGSLSWLSVRRNTLLDMPGALLASWRQLTHLDLRDNKLKALPEEIGECTSLTELLLTGNQLVDLPEGIGRCSHLEVLLANRNQLAALPAGLIGCSALIQLDVTGNKLTDIPGSILTGMVNLKVLMAGFNKLSSLPTEIACCSALEVLSVASNAIKSLPDEVGSLVNLREIYAGNNAMTALPATVTNWTQLETGNFRNCKLKALPPGVDQAWMQATLVDVRAKGKKDTCKQSTEVQEAMKKTRLLGFVWQKPKKKGKK